jgi:hypothetical protein
VVAVMWSRAAFIVLIIAADHIAGQLEATVRLA